MSNKNQASSPADFFSGGGDLFKNLAEEEKRKKLAAANAAPQPPGTEKPGLPTARPSAPLSPVRDVAAGVGNKNSNTEKAQAKTSGEGLEEYKRQNGVAAMDRSLKALAQPKTEPEPGVLDNIKGGISGWWRAQEERRKSTQAGHEKNARRK